MRARTYCISVCVLVITVVLLHLQKPESRLEQGWNHEPQYSAVQKELEDARTTILQLVAEGQFHTAAELEAMRYWHLVMIYGEEHNQTLRSLENLSSFYFSLEEIKTAGQLLDRVIELRTKTQGETHPDTLAAIASYVGYLQLLGHLREAEELGTRVVQVCREVLGPDAVGTQRALSNLAAVYLDEGDYAAAEELFVEVVQLRRKSLPADDPKLARSLLNLAAVYSGQLKWSESAALFESVLNTRRKMLGDEHNLTAIVACSLAQAYEEMELWNDAEVLRLLVLHVTKKQKGVEHADTVLEMEALILSYLETKRWKECMTMIEGVIRILEKQSPLDEAKLDEMHWWHSFMLVQFPDGLPAPPPGSFEYHPLDPEKKQIRLVSIKKGRREDPLEAHLIDASTTKFQDCEALSYVLGSLKALAPILLHGHEFETTQNLRTALLYLRSETKDRILWIDAICINQNSLSERNSQVQLMRDIYTNAQRTIIWLGEAKAESDLAMNFLIDMEHHPSPSDFIAMMFREWPTHPVFDALKHLYGQRPYWKRLWVIQEVQCTSDVVVHCGSLSVNLTVLQKVMNIFVGVLQTSEFHSSTEQNLQLVDYLLRRGPSMVMPGSWHTFHASSVQQREPKPLLSLLLSHKNAACTDPRDRVYALLGLSSLHNTTHPSLRIDYTLPVSAVYLNVARAIIESTHSLDILCLSTSPVSRKDTGHYRPRQPFLPSWAPDWNTYWAATPLSSLIATTANASGHLPAVASFSDDGMTLTVQGLRLPPIQIVQEGLDASKSDSYTFREVIRILLAARLYAQACLGMSPTSTDPADERLDPFYRMLVFDNPALQGLPDWRARWAAWQAKLLQEKSLEAIQIDTPTRLYLQTISDHLMGRRVFLFGTGVMKAGVRSNMHISHPAYGRERMDLWMGIGPLEMKEGDQLVVLRGCRHPVVLRRKADGRYVVVGDAYVSGYMSGEALEEVEEGGLGWEEFVLV
jgi:tetratricopeptide (TPR) repeat protein